MKKARKLFLVCLMAVLALATFMFAACGEKNISVITRESGSGTRSAFEELVEKDGKSLKELIAESSAQEALVKGIIEQSSTAAVISMVASTPTAIGFVSLGSVDDSVKVLTLNGVAANSANVLNDTYGLKRPFVVAYNPDNTLTDLTQDFVNYLASSDAQDIVVEEGYVTVETASTVAYECSLTENVTASDKVVIRGSTSMDELMDKLLADYISLAGHGLTASNFDKQCEGSSAGVSAAKNDTTGNVIGMSSSALAAADDEALTNFEIAMDAIAIIVNKDNDQIDNITVSQLYDIYTGAVTKYSQLAE